jgi:acyl-CoA synthetase (NDP forming)
LDLRAFFEPKSVAAVGASREPGRPGYSLLKNLISMGYKGKIFPVNPNLKVSRRALQQTAPRGNLGGQDTDC